MAKSNSNRLSYGLIILVVGIIYLLSKTGILMDIPYAERLMNIGTFFLIAGIIFLLTKAEKTMGIIFTGIGLIMNFDFFFGWLRNYSSLIVPVVLIAIGLGMVITSRR